MTGGEIFNVQETMMTTIKMVLRREVFQEADRLPCHPSPGPGLLHVQNRGPDRDLGPSQGPDLAPGQDRDRDHHRDLDLDRNPSLNQGPDRVLRRLLYL